jgi:hypothetical protein
MRAQIQESSGRDGDQPLIRSRTATGREATRGKGRVALSRSQLLRGARQVTSTRAPDEVPGAFSLVWDGECPSRGFDSGFRLFRWERKLPRRIGGGQRELA